MLGGRCWEGGALGGRHGRGGWEGGAMGRESNGKEESTRTQEANINLNGQLQPHYILPACPGLAVIQITLSTHII